MLWRWICTVLSLCQASPKHRQGGFCGVLNARHEQPQLSKLSKAPFYMSNTPQLNQTAQDRTCSTYQIHVK